MAPKVKFAENEKVLCFHGPLLYEAKCMKHEIGKDKVARYYIHYNGWNKHWDEWVPESRVLKCNEAGLNKQKELHKAHLALKKTKSSKKEREKLTTNKQKIGRPSVEKTKPQEKPSVKPKAPEKPDKQKPVPVPPPLSTERNVKPPQEKGRSSVAVERAKAATDRRTASLDRQKPTSQLDKVKAAITDRGKHKLAQSSTTSERSRSSTPTPTTDAQKRKRARLDATIESEESFMTKVEVKVTIPDSLKPWLVDDWDLITRQKNLVSVPCKKTIDDILKDYGEFRRSDAQNIDTIIEVTNGIREYFNVILGTQLLFKFERPQYGEILSDYPNKPMTSLYGAAHLLRLFVRLGGMLVYTTLDEKTMPLLLTHIHDFLQYLKDNSASLFVRTDYVVAPPEYHRKAI